MSLITEWLCTSQLGLPYHNKVLQTGSLKQQKQLISSSFWKFKIKFQQPRFLLRPLSLSGRQSPSHGVVTWPFLCVPADRVSSSE